MASTNYIKNKGSIEGAPVAVGHSDWPVCRDPMMMKRDVVVAFKFLKLDLHYYDHYIDYNHYIMICGVGMFEERPLLGRTVAPLTYSSSLTVTSSPSTHPPSIRTHLPTLVLHPMIEEAM